MTKWAEIPDRLKDRILHDTGEGGDTPARKQLRKESGSSLERTFDTFWAQLYPGIEWEQKFRFNVPYTNHEIDRALPDLRIGVEINGGQWVTSGHSSGTGLHRDAWKLNQAQAKGWRLFVLTTDMLTGPGVAEHLRLIADVIQGEI